MKRFQHHHIFLSSLFGGEEQPEEAQEVLRVGLSSDGVGEVTVRFVSSANRMRKIIVTISMPENAQSITADFLRRTVETSIAALRLNVDRGISPVFTTQGPLGITLETDNVLPNINFILGQPRSNQNINADKIMDTLSYLVGVRELNLTSFYLESQLPGMPLHYRVLSLIRAIEVMYDERPDMDAFLDKYQEAFAQLRISNKLFKNALHELRARCAHGKPNGKNPQQPFIGVGFWEPELAGLYKLLNSIIEPEILKINNITAN